MTATSVIGFLTEYCGVHHQAHDDVLAVGGESGFNLFTAAGANFAMPFGANVEYDINGTLSIVGRLSADIGFGTGKFNIFYINPEVRYHFSQVFDGAYVGGYTGFGPASRNTFYFSLGAVGGYEMMLKENFNLDISGQLGYARRSASGFGAGGLQFRPTVALRYVF